MKATLRAGSAVIWLGLIALVAWELRGVHLNFPLPGQGDTLDWVMGGLCLLWLIILLKAPWDLYFKAQEVTFELQRARERGIQVPEGREEYVERVAPKLLYLAVGAHVGSAALIAIATFFSHGVLGYYFAGFYLVSTAFRPMIAGYVYLMRKFHAIHREAEYPREDVVELRNRVVLLEGKAKAFDQLVERMRTDLNEEARERDAEDRAMRQGLTNMARQFDDTINRLSDNQDVLRGLQAFVRLIQQATQS